MRTEGTSLCATGPSRVIRSCKKCISLIWRRSTILGPSPPGQRHVTREITWRHETRTDDKTNVRKCGTYAWCGRYEKIDSLSVGKTRNNNNGYCTKKNRAQGGQRVPSRSLARVLTRVCRRFGTRWAKMVRDYRVGDNVNRLWRKIRA